LGATTNGAAWTMSRSSANTEQPTSFNMRSRQAFAFPNTGEQRLADRVPLAVIFMACKRTTKLE
jgi:hypothetical protein